MAVWQRPALIAGIVGPPAFVVVALIAGAVRPGYNAVRMPISLLALGDGGWIQTLNFVALGAAMLAFAAGLRRKWADAGEPNRWVPALIGLFGVGLLGAGLFSTDPGAGFPPGAQRSSGTGSLHDLASIVVFVSLPALALVVARRAGAQQRRGWAIYSAATGIAFLGGFILMLVAFNSTSGMSAVGGLIQRATVIVGWTWLMALGVDAFSGARSHEAAA
jgi:hypothetical membrane protein